MTRMFFKTEQGLKVDPIQHSLDMILKYPNVQIYVGSDSQSSKRSTVYATVIAYRYGNKGVHFIFKKDKMKKIRDRWTRLWKEAEMTAEAALFLRTNMIPVHVVELDYNKGDKNSGSHMMVSAGEGYLKGLGFDYVITKPFEQVAVKAANHKVQ